MSLAASSVDPKEQLVALFRARIAYSPAQLDVLSSMNRSQLALMLDTTTAAVAAVASTPAPKSARTLCESDLPGTTIELRRLAVQRGIARASTLTKKQLCVALAAIQNESYVQEKEEELELPAGFLDMVTQEVMRDPIVASDGYSYGYKSLRNMFLFAAAGPQRRVLSLKDPSLELENPFPDVPGWPASFPLIRNHDLRHSIDEWLLQHGWPNESEGKEEELVHSRRDGEGFENGIFVGEGGGGGGGAQEQNNLGRERAMFNLADLAVPETLVRLDEMRERHSRELDRESSVSLPGIDALRREIERLVLVDDPTEWEPHAVHQLRHVVHEMAPELRFNALVQFTRMAHLFADDENADSIDQTQVVNAIKVTSYLDIVSTDETDSFAGLPRLRDGFVSARDLQLWVRGREQSVVQPGLNTEGVCELLREIDNSALLRVVTDRFAEHEHEHNPRRLSPEEQARSILSELGIYTYSDLRETFAARMGADHIFVALGQGWEILPRRQTIRLLVDAIALLTPHTQFNSDWSWIPPQGVIVGIQKEALDLLSNHAWPGFAPLREIIADLVAYVASAKHYIINTKHVQRAMDLLRPRT